MPTILDPSNDALEVHEWLEQVNDGVDIRRLEPLPLATVCTSAVDPLEIAVALEVAGISHAVATERYNRADVFALARTLWNRTPLRPATATSVERPRAGDHHDLGRGALYAIPAVMVLAITVAFDITLAAWVLPLAISWGWGVSQVAAFVGYRVQDADAAFGDTMMSRVTAGAIVSTCLVALIALAIGGGGRVGVVAATLLVTYMVASAVLLVRNDERALAVLLMPGAIASALVLLVWKTSTVSRCLTVVFVGASFLAVLVRALHHARLHVIGAPKRFVRHDIAIGCSHLLHGVICGLAVSFVILQTGHPEASDSFARILLPMPLLASLGVMEWQLHTFRHRIAELAHSLHSVETFPEQAWYVFCRSLAICAATMVVTASAIAFAVWIRGDDVPIDVLALQCGLGVVFFADLVLMLLDRLQIILRCWLGGIATGGAALLGTRALTANDTRAALTESAAVLVVFVLCSLLFVARQVVSAAMNH